MTQQEGKKEGQREVVTLGPPPLPPRHTVKRGPQESGRNCGELIGRPRTLEPLFQKGVLLPK